MEFSKRVLMKTESLGLVARGQESPRKYFNILPMFDSQQLECTCKLRHLSFQQQYQGAARGMSAVGRAVESYTWECGILPHPPQHLNN